MSDYFIISNQVLYPEALLSFKSSTPEALPTICKPSRQRHLPTDLPTYRPTDLLPTHSAAMASRRKTPTDYSAVKKSRAALTGAITKAWDKFSSIEFSQPEEVLRIRPKEVERFLSSITRTEAGFRQSLEEAQQFAPEDEAEEAAFQREEEEAADTFEEHLSATRVLGEQLLTSKQTLSGISTFRNDLEALQYSLNELPDGDHQIASTTLQVSLSSLKEQWLIADLPPDHPLKRELDACSKSVMTMQAQVAAARSRSAAPTPITSSPAPSAPHHHSYNELPKIKVPTFNGDLMKWSTFWSTFKATVEDRRDLNNSQRLNYLRQAVTDPSLQLLLTTPFETDDTYLDVIKELKARFQRPREIHRALTKSLAHVAAPKQTSADLIMLYDTLKCGMANLKSTGHYHLDAFLASNTYAVLPTKVQTLWDQHSQKEKGVPTIDQLLEFIKAHAETLPATPYQAPADKTPDSNKKPTYQQKKKEYQAKNRHPIHVASPAAPVTQRWECTICAPERHPLYLCPKWATYTVQQRLNHISTKSLCSNCLAGGHTTSNCKSTRSCRDCNQRHHTTIHQQAVSTPVNHAASLGVGNGLLPTAQVIIVAPNGRELKARALIDEGAGLSLITKRAAQLLELPLTPERLTLSVAQGETTKPLTHSTSFSISSLHDRNVKIPCDAAVAPTVTCDLPPLPIHQVQDLPHIMGLPLADPDYHVPGRIDLLLGSPLLPHFMANQLGRRGGKDEPVAQHTPFGWTLGGPSQPLNPTSVVAAYHQTPIIQDSTPETDEPRLDDLLHNLWKDQEPDEGIPAPTPVEQKVEDHYLATTIYLPDQKRYQVTLPKTDAVQDLGLSKAQAVSRFISNERSILRRKIHQPFQEVVETYLELGHSEEVPPEDSPPAHHFYLPMHCVFKESSTSTKLRVVFDGSAVTTSGLSLNQALLVGPTIQATLSSIILKFRTYPVALNSDVSKMYREVQLSAPDKDLHRFVWRRNTASPIQDFRMTRVTFGVSASPFLAVRTLQRTADDHGEDYPEATRHIKSSFYVDDFLGGAANPQEAIKLFSQIREVLQKGGFHLMKWRSTSQEVLNAIPPDLLETNPVKISTSANKKTQSKALGLQWDSQLDVMSPSISISDSYTTTKRGLVSDVSRTYDVLGWIAPTILTMKIMFQQLWQTGHGWDDQASDEAIQLHQDWRKELPTLATKTIPRCYSLPTHRIKERTLHGFSDASQAAYGAVVYCRTTYHDHPPTMSLVTAKTKVSKLNPPTVPRLELCGAALLAKLLLSVGDVLNIQSSQWQAWSDSSIVLAWLDGNPRQHPVFVANRVTAILQITPPSIWHYVPTSCNPADCASRGLMPTTLLEHSLWWEGPTWLKEDPPPLPKQPPRKPLPDAGLPTCTLQQTTSTAEQLALLPQAYPHIISIAAWCRRFFSRLKQGRPDPDTRTRHLTGQERREAEQWSLPRSPN